VAVDFIHRLVVSGAPDEVRTFRRAVARTVHRPSIGRVRSWREDVPLSFAAMYAVCPELTRVVPTPPYDPYDLAVWPTASLADGRAEVRYTFHTRNLEVHDFFVLISRKFKKLVFVLVTFCLDDSSIVSHLIRNGRGRQYTLPEKRQEWHWDRAREWLRLTGDQVYEHADARCVAEEGMLEEALGRWDQLIEVAWEKELHAPGAIPEANVMRRGKKPSRATAKHVRRTRDWWNRPKVRDLEFEQAVAMHELAGAANARSRVRETRLHPIGGQGRSK
jgi:hypothetical protein